MKSIKIASIAAFATLGATSSIFAQETIRIVASNGDRTATQTAISKLLAPGWTFQGINGNTTTGSDLTIATNANFGAWRGSYNGTQVIIKVSYSGALAGIAAIAGDTDQRFVVTDGTGTGAVPNPLTGTTLNGDYQIGRADFGFSTNFQSTSPFNGLYNGHTYNTVLEENVGVSPLGFYASPGYPGDNITTQQAQLLYTRGSLRLAQLTGDWTNDSNKTVWAIGRNTDAGQRFGAYTEIGLGTAQDVLVWSPKYAAGNGPTTTSGITYGGVIESHEPWPEEGEINGIEVPLGSGGFNSGANVAQRLTVTLGPDAYKGLIDGEELYPDAVEGYYIGYVTPGDANNRILGQNGVVPEVNRGKKLKYNGVELTDANVRSGIYTAWLYNRIIKPTDGRLNGFKLQFANALRDQIKNTDAVSGGGLLDDASFRVQRSTDGGLVEPK